ncbi:MAG: TOBE domain-containing protein [Synechococcus lacustris]|jgi:molybdate transport system regulatory protein
MKVSARNVLIGTVTGITAGAVNSEVDLSLAGGESLVAIITNKSAESLGILVGKPVVALVKASSILLLTDSSGYKLSARNIIKASIQSVTPGAVNAEVSLALANGTAIHAIVTLGAVQELGLAAGGTAEVVIKASSIILGVPN